MLSTVRRGVTDPGENHLVIPLKYFHRCPPSLLAATLPAIKVPLGGIDSLAADRGQSSPGAFRFTLLEGIQDSGLKGKET